MTFESSILSAKKLIDKKGGICNYVTQTSGSVVDPSAPHRAKNKVSDSHSVIAVFVPFSQKSGVSKSSKLTLGSMNSKNIVYMAASGLTFTPKSGDSITRDGESLSYNVVDVDEINPNGEKILYTLTVGA